LENIAIPLFVHGDGIQYANSMSLMVWSWGALVTCFNSLQSKCLIYFLLAKVSNN
jgi:hypothetical protein